MVSRCRRALLKMHAALFALLCGPACDAGNLLDPKGDPELVVEPESLRFGESLTLKTFTVSNGGGGGGTLDWSVAVDPASPWCTASPDAGSDRGTVAVTVDRAGLTPTEHTARITVDSNAGIGEVQVYVIVLSPTGEIVIDVPLPE
ncbi:BACON domain-containing protein [Candidatus Latescibacterota bacterium]